MTTPRQHAPNVKLTGPSFISIQVRDLPASMAFYVDTLGLTQSPKSPPGAIVFDTKPIPFAIRTAIVDLDATSKLGWGVSLWVATTDADALHVQLTASGVPIVLPPSDGPFGRFFAFADPDGYTITVHTEQPRHARNS